MKHSLYDTIMRSCPARGRVRQLGRSKKGLKVYNEKCKAKPKTKNTSVLKIMCEMEEKVKILEGNINDADKDTIKSSGERVLGECRIF